MRHIAWILQLRVMARSHILLEVRIRYAHWCINFSVVASKLIHMYIHTYRYVGVLIHICCRYQSVYRYTTLFMMRAKNLPFPTVWKKLPMIPPRPWVTRVMVRTITSRRVTFPTTQNASNVKRPAGHLTAWPGWGASGVGCQPIPPACQTCPTVMGCANLAYLSQFSYHHKPSPFLDHN